MKVYDWCFFFENGTKNYLYLPFGPEGDNNARIWYDVEDSRLDQVEEIYPHIREILSHPDKHFFMIIVNPPKDISEMPDDFAWSPEVMDWLEDQEL